MLGLLRGYLPECKAEDNLPMNSSKVFYFGLLYIQILIVNLQVLEDPV